MARRGGGGGGCRKRPRPLERENVDGFHARVTSEDNAEFEANMRREARVKRDIMDIVYNSTGGDYKNVQNKLLAYQNDGVIADGKESRELAGEQEQRLMLCDTPLMASDEFNPPVQRIHVAGTTADGKRNKTHRNSLFFTPRHDAFQDIDAERTGGNGSFLEESRFKTSLKSQGGDTDTTTQSIMPPPSAQSSGSATAIISSLPSSSSSSRSQSKPTSLELRSKIHQTNQAGGIQSKMHLVEYQVKPKSTPSAQSNEKQIIPSNTRFSYQNESRLISQRTADQSALERSNNLHSYSKDATTEDYYSCTTDASTDLDASPLHLDMERRARQRRIERDRNTYVTMTPIILPGGVAGEGGSDGDDSPIITWGNVASTPLVTGGDNEEMQMQMQMSISSKSANDYGVGGGASHDTGEDNVEFRLPDVDPKELKAKAAEVKVAKQTERFHEAGRGRGQRGDNSSIDGMKRSRENSKSRICSTPSSLSKRSSLSSGNSILDRTKSLTPAARALLERSTTPKKHSSSLGIPLSSSSAMLGVSARSRSAFGSALRGSYSCTPKMQASKSSSKGSAHRSRSRKSDIHKATPLASAATTERGSARRLIAGDIPATHNILGDNIVVGGEKQNGSSTSGLLKLS